MMRLPCPPELWARFSSLLDTALDLPEAELADWIERLAGEDAAVKPWLVRVLEAEGALETGFLRARPHLAPHSVLEPGTIVGPYRLESRLGEGGMGEVWRASRADDGPRREVALKLPHPELLGGPFRQRFARERDVLAALSHPHIAQLYDAGLSAEGHPYLALELVEGRPINEDCIAEHASLQRRVELVGQVLEALTYAHQRLIVHRDIKPTNVLVTPQGGVKLLDFGIAKLLRPTEAEDGRLTQAVSRLATPAYAAPEQLQDGEITVATDIFSVGVLLFELCTGQRPFVVAPFGPDAREAPLASHRANANAAGMNDAARLARALHGDLDAIIARALALDPRARYSSAEAFARDLARWRDGLPVAARRVGWATLSLKFARRNKVGVALAAVLALALAGGTAGIAWQARVAARAAARAEHEAARANAVKNYLIGLFEQGDPRGGGKPSETMTVKELLDRGTDQINTALGGQPETAMELLDTLGQIYEVLEDPDRAMQAESRRLQLARALYGDNDPRVVNGTIDLAESHSEFLDRPGAQVLLQTIRRSVFTHYGADSLERARWLTAWADSLRTTNGGLSEALADARQAVAIFQSHYPTNDDYMSALFELADFQADADQYEASLVTLQQRQHVLAAQGSNDAIHKLEYMTAAGNTLRHLGRYDEAEKLLAENQALAEKIVGRQGGYYLAGLRTMALIANDLGKRAEAMALFSQGMAIATGRGATTGGVNSLRRAYGRVLIADDDATAAIPLLEETLRQTQLHPRDESDLPLNQGYLGDAYDQAGRTAEARPLLQAARDYWVRYGIATGTFTLGARERWARFLMDHNDAQAARAECTEILRVAAGAASAPAALAQADLARMALVRGDSAEAEHFSAQAMQTIDAVKLGYDVRTRTDVWLTRAESLSTSGKKPQAAELAARALAAAQDSDAPGSARLARAVVVVRETQ
jgi:eukaryotic-like serine/threonine-protein kinase